MVKNLPANVEDISDAGLIPGSGRSPGEGNGNPFQYSCLGNIMDRVPGTRRIRVAPAGAMSRNLRTALIFGGFISLIGAAFYPIYFRPLMRLEEYKKEQAINRAGIVQEDVQPPGLKVWSDPFGRK